MNIFKYLFLIPFLAISLTAMAEAENDTLFVPSLRLGVDVSGFARHLIEPETITGEITLDLEWRKSHFFVAEGGLLQVDVEKETHIYQADGYFIRIGADFNILERNPDSPNDVVLLSLRYGYGKLEHEAPFIMIASPYWGNRETAISAESYRAHWLEAGIGLKTEIWRDIFMGWSLRGRLMLSDTSSPAMDPYFVSGFGKSGNNTNLTLHYHVMYRVPLR